MVVFVVRKLILPTCMHSHQVGIDVWFFDRTLRLLSYFLFANIDGSGETARMRRLAWVFAGRHVISTIISISLFCLILSRTTTQFWTHLNVWLRPHIFSSVIIIGWQIFMHFFLHLCGVHSPTLTVQLVNGGGKIDIHLSFLAFLQFAEEISRTLRFLFTLPDLRQWHITFVC